jgi:hypothetical protein
MADNSEIEEIVAFVRDQRARVQTMRQWRRRLAAFGFSIDQTEAGLVIAKLPRHRVVCPVPQELIA